MVKRISPLPEDDTSMTRTIHAKGFPGREGGYSMEDVQSVFSKFGKILCIRLRKTIDKKQKESCFVEYSTADEAQAAAAEQKLSFKNKPLTVLMKSDYYQKKKEAKKKILDEKKAKRKVEREEMDQERGGKRRKTEMGHTKDEPRISGSIVKFSEIGDGITWQTVQEAFAEFGATAYIDFPKGEATGTKEGFVRFHSPELAKQVVEKMQEAKVSIGGKVPELKILDETAEREYWENAQILQEARRAKRQEEGGEEFRGRGGRGRGRGRGRGGRGGRGRGGRGGRGRRF